MHRSILMMCAALSWLCAALASGQSLPVSAGTQIVETDSGEAWAMRFVGASSIMTGMGAAPELAPGEWALSAELGHIPHLDADQQRVGLGGSKQEDLNKSPVFGRGRVWLGLPGGVIAEFGYTPPIEIDGTRPEDLFGAALSRRWRVGKIHGVGVRLLGQHGGARGDITCPAGVVGTSMQNNPFRCSRRSDDRIDLNYYGAETTWDLGRDAWSVHGTVGWLRYEPRVQVNAELTQYVERIRLLNSASMRYLAVGTGYDWSPKLRFVTELLYVPLDVRRPDAFARESDDFWSLRFGLRWRP